MPTTEDLIDLALAQQPINFAAALNDVLSMRAMQAVEALRPEVAASLFADDDLEDEDEDPDDDFEDEEDWAEEESEESEDLEDEDDNEDS